MPSVVLLSLCKEDVAPGVDLVLSGAAREVPLSSAESTKSSETRMEPKQRHQVRQKAVLTWPCFS
jgi:hypothetical protein